MISTFCVCVLVSLFVNVLEHESKQSVQKTVKQG